VAAVEAAVPAVVAGPVVAAQAVPGAAVEAAVEAVVVVVGAAARAVAVAAVEAVALRVFPCQAAALEEVAPSWVAPAPPVCSCRGAERLAHLSGASRQAAEIPEPGSVASLQAMPALTACPMEAALQAAEIDHLVLSVVALRVAATVYPVYRVAAWSAE